MSNANKIIENHSSSELLKQLQAFQSLEKLYKAIPFAKTLFPKLEDTFSRFADLRDQAEILAVPDRFNDLFGSLGWVAYESMNLEAMKEAIHIAESMDINAAEEHLATYYNKETIEFGIQRFKSHPEFRRRLRLIELAKTDYLAQRYHACIPLLLSLLDGLANDISNHVGFFAKSSDMTAWDCIAAHETGLQSLASLMRKGRKKTNDEVITLPFRNGILHGRELAFDNHIVAAKCWAAIFATRDWAAALAEGKKEPKIPKQVTWKELLNSLVENQKQKALLEEWKPRISTNLLYLPHSGPFSELPIDSPEYAVSEFIYNWTKKRYGLLAERLLYFYDLPASKKAGRAREDFGHYTPLSHTVESIEDQAAAATQVNVSLSFDSEEGAKEKQASVRAIYQDAEGNPLMRGQPNGSWKIVQNSFSEIIYQISL